MNVFITGGSGFVGSHVIEHLVAKGHAVHAMARSASSVETVKKYGAVAVQTDLDTITTEQLRGIDVVVHAAAWVSGWGTRADFIRGNVTGTERMLAVAKEAGVPRFIHVSTEAVLFTGKPLPDVDESMPIPQRHQYLYPETKAAAERAVRAANAPGFETVVLRPRMVWGPRDATILPQILGTVKSGAFAWLDGGSQPTSTTYVGNFAHAVELALTKGRGGEVYFIADAERSTIRSFISRLAQTAGVTMPSKSMPGWLVRPLANLVEGTWRVLGVKTAPPLMGFGVDLLSREVTVRTDKARDELGYVPPFTVDAGLKRM